MPSTPHPDTDPGRVYALARHHAQALRRQAIDAFWRSLAQALQRRAHAWRGVGGTRRTHTPHIHTQGA